MILLMVLNDYDDGVDDNSDDLFALLRFQCIRSRFVRFRLALCCCQCFKQFRLVFVYLQLLLNVRNLISFIFVSSCVSVSVCMYFVL